MSVDEERMRFSRGRCRDRTDELMMILGLRNVKTMSSLYALQI